MLGLRRFIPLISRNRASIIARNYSEDVQYIPLGLDGDDDASRLGLGAWGLSSIPEKNALAIIHHAIDRGVTLIDSVDLVDSKSLRGDNERLIAKAIKTYKGTTELDEVMVATHAGRVIQNGHITIDASPDHIFSSCQQSLQALDVDCIPLFQLAGVDPRTPLSESIRALQRLQDMKLIKHIGLSNVTKEQLEKAQDITRIATVQVCAHAGNMNDHLPMIGLCRKNNISFIAHSPLGGLQSNEILMNGPIKSYCDMMIVKNDDGEATVPTPAQAALHILLTISPSTIVLPGALSVKHLYENMDSEKLEMGESMQDKANSFRDKVLAGETGDASVGGSGLSGAQMRDILGKMKDLPVEEMVEELKKVPPGDLEAMLKEMGFDPSKFGGR